MGETPFGDLNLTYVGHSPVQDVIVHTSYIYIDQGVCPRAGGPATGRPRLCAARPKSN